MIDPIIINGNEKWLDKLCELYQGQTIIFRDATDKTYTNALIDLSRSRSMIIGVYNNTTDIGKIFERRKNKRIKE